MDRKLGGVVVALLVSSWASAQEIPVGAIYKGKRTTTTYSCIEPNGTRTYSNRPRAGKCSASKIEYPLYELPANAGVVYRCVTLNGLQYASKPVGGNCTAVSTYVKQGQPYFRGFRCTQDCSGHEAGYAWARKRGVKEPSQCGGNSRSFYEGCLAWADEH
jgi:hypothetical protein